MKFQPTKSNEIALRAAARFVTEKPYKAALAIIVIVLIIMIITAAVMMH